MREYFQKFKSILFKIFAFLGICSCLLGGLLYFGFSKIKSFLGSDICVEVSEQGDNFVLVRLREWSDCWNNAQVKIKLENGNLKGEGGENVVLSADGKRINVDGCEIVVNENGVITFGGGLSNKFRARIALDAGVAQVENSQNIAFENIVIRCGGFTNRGNLEADEFRLYKCSSAKSMEETSEVLNTYTMRCKNFHSGYFCLINDGAIFVDTKLNVAQIVNRGTICFERKGMLNADQVENLNTISAKGSLLINADTIRNQGKMLCDKSEKINVDRLENFDIIRVNNDLGMNLDILSNQGKIACGGDLKCNADNLENAKAIAVAGDLRLNVSTVSNQGKIACGSDLKCNADILENIDAISVGGDLRVNASTVKNQGTISYGGRRKFNVDHDENIGRIVDGDKSKTKEQKKIKEISLVPYDTRWSKQYEAEKTAIAAALGDNCLCIYHIGSTSVPGLAAKPKIDIIAAAKNRDRAIKTLESIGYRHRGEWGIPLQCGFAKRGKPDVNLHLFFDMNHPEIELNLSFRDYLRKNPTARNEYAKIKREILEDSSSRLVSEHSSDGIFPNYTLRKAPFINSVLRKVGYNRLRVLKANSDEQWAMVKKFQIRAQKSEKKDKMADKTKDKKPAEYFLLYRGVKIIGCAEILVPSKNALKQHAKITMLEIEDQAPDARSFFENLIKEWCAIQGYELN